MIISYASSKIKELCENKEKFIKKYGCDIFYSFAKKCKLLSSNTIVNIGKAQMTHKGLHFEKLKGAYNSTGSFRLNKKYRVNFEYRDSIFDEVVEIFIVKIHKHDGY